ncbi:MAG: helix-turn-helix transcriptional regulator [Chloroflexi bacterium]|nr:helix-turn-helix transcriptional regulator [Chloroflexota bacterium]MCI0783682.1 helix-turn-helix transcriptional regulator [Chloroflexota bacterium]MCI0813742.1 helix-turn-helix transcriptional regulator [Chloroflexota bacterium]MCI0817805.1 helix-turn-helix transcriptional regulator [Chloroflexota bacterium]MCI0819964.1 helix-turn-helix transcriptional regulator [Chloroflexota bacterium]
MGARRNHRDLTKLTSRERDVLDLLGQELTNEQIAEQLGISLDGAKYHVSQILSKLGVSRREEAVRATSGRIGRLARLGLPISSRIIGGALLATRARRRRCLRSEGGPGQRCWAGRWRPLAREVLDLHRRRQAGGALVPRLRHDIAGRRNHPHRAANS